MESRLIFLHQLGMALNRAGTEKGMLSLVIGHPVQARRQIP